MIMNTYTGKSLMGAFMLPLLIVLLHAYDLWAHGVRCRAEQAGAFVVRAVYDDGEPMSYAGVKVFSPEDARVEYQNGRTDRRGRFAFVPDAPGAWVIRVNDGMGHAVRAEVAVPGDRKRERQQAVSTEGQRLDDRTNRYEKALMGLAILFGLFGWLFWWKGRAPNRTRKET